MSPSIETSTLRTLVWRVVPLLAAGAVLQGFSQLNVGFAGLQMTRALGLSGAEFGFGAGIFFLSYIVLGIPANIAMLKVGARRWIALAMGSWGLLSLALAFVTSPWQFYLARLLLGAAEAGFIPGILYLSNAWFPERHRGRVLSLLMVCNPVSAVLGGPICGALLDTGGAAGLAGWQWIFIVAGLPALLMVPLVLWLLPDDPTQARWLTAEQRAWLAAAIAPPAAAQAQQGSVLAALVDRRVITFCLIFFGVAFLPFGLIFFLPKIIEAFGVSAAAAAWLSATPFASGALLMLVWGHSSDRSGERLHHALVALGLALAGCVLYLLSPGPLLGLAGLCLTFGGVFAFLPIFWTLPGRLLAGATAANGLGVINSMGSIAGIVAPTLMGALKDATGGYQAGLTVSMVTASAAGMLLFVFGRRVGLHRPC